MKKLVRFIYFKSNIQIIIYLFIYEFTGITI